MQFRRLGKTGFQVSEIGFGAWGIGGGMWGRPDDTEGRKALHKAFELGVNFFDTARVYGGLNSEEGHSEKLLGAFLKEIGRDRVYIASKVPPKNYRWPASANVSIREVFPKDWIIQKVEESLQALAVETIDLMQFHVWQDYFVEDAGWKEAIEQLTKQGKVKSWGLSLNDYQPENCQRTIETGLISTVQLIFNLFHQKPSEVFPFFKKHDVGLIARVPLDEGGLSGNIREDTTFALDDFRRHYFSAERRRELVQRLIPLEKLLGTESKSIPELALRYTLSFDEVSVVIPGMRKESHAVANATVSDGRRLSSELLLKLREHRWERNFYASGWRKVAGWAVSKMVGYFRKVLSS